MSSVITAPSNTEQVFDVQVFPTIVAWAAEIIRERKNDAIVACGHSGLLLAGALSFLTGVPTIAVRKPGEQSVAAWGEVSSVLKEGPAKRWAWVDDLMLSGGTLQRSAREAYNAGAIVHPWPDVLVLYQEWGQGGWYKTEHLHLDRHFSATELERMPGMVAHFGYRK